MAGADEHTVIVAMDASAQAAHAMDYYLSFLYRSGHKIKVVHAVELPQLKDAKHNFMTPGRLQELLIKEQAKASEIAKKCQTAFHEKWIPPSDYEFLESQGKPGEQIVHMAEETRAKMIVIGTRGMGTIRRTIMGSVSEYVVHHSHCPVIVCRQ